MPANEIGTDQNNKTETANDETGSGGDESTGTVLVALAANIAVALAKLAAGLVSGSGSMLSEAAHSVADVLNEVFLLAALRRGDRPADLDHPFGYGKERFFWSLIAAVGIFVSGALFSLYQGVHGLLSGGEQEGHYALTYVVLVFALVVEGLSLAKAARQVRNEARERGRGVREHIRRSSDPTVKTVASEDSAAVAGILIALVGVGLHQLTGSAVYDSFGAITIGLLLAFVAYALGRDTKDLLIGESADPELRLAIYEAIVAYEEVDAVVNQLTMQIGPHSVLLAVRLDLAADLDSSAVEDVSTRIEEDLQRRFPSVREVFLDATRATDADRERVRSVVETLERQRALGGRR